MSSRDLRYLATQLATGALGPPYPYVALNKLGMAGPTLVADLERLNAQGFSPAQLAWLVVAVAGEREHLERPNTQIELVATGLEAQAQARDTLVVVEQLFAEAQESVLVVGFAVFQGNEIFKTLAKRMMESPGLQVVCCFDVARDRDDNRPERVIIDDFARRFIKYQWPGSRVPEIYFDRRSLIPDREKRAVLHAKTIVVDRRKALLTSANPTPAAYLRNIELGIVLTGGEIPLEIESYFRSLISDGRLERLPL
jgi:phosphatidylserine/phosphatidylglycerophosphate/cardiolipin synthase-like enzyme